MVELADATSNQSRFFDDDYSCEIRRMALAAVDVEGPVRDDIVVRRVARAHGFARAGARIRDRVLSLIPRVTATAEKAGRFLWACEKPPETVAFRYSEQNDERRSLDEVPMQELMGLVQSRPDLAASEDTALAFAREIGLARLSKSARERLESAIERAAGGR